MSDPLEPELASLIWQGTVSLPAGYTSSSPVQIVGTATVSVPGLAQINGQVSGSGELILAGGTLDLTALNTNSGGIIIDANTTLEVGNNSAGGTGPISFGSIGATLLIDAGVTPSETIDALQAGDYIDAAGINGGTIATAGNQLVISNGATSLTLNLDRSYDASQFRSFADGSGGTMVYLPPAQPYVVPIYHSAGPNLIIYASLNGGPLDPYLLDSGSPNMFSAYGSWWPGYTTEVSQQGTASFSFANGVTYYYNSVPTSISLGTQSGGTVAATAANVNVAQITNVGTDTPAQDFAAWASAVAEGNPPFGSDDTFGNFSAGLYGSNSLATVLAQIPIGANLKTGFIIEANGTGAAPGTLTVGLDPAVLAAWESNPATIILPMQQSGTTLPNPDGNPQSVNGYQKAQVGDTTVTLTQDGTAASYAIPLVIDTGGGPNNIVYNPGNVPDLSAYHPDDTSTVNNGTGFELSGTTTSGGTANLLNYIANPGTLPTGGNTDIISTTSIPGTLRTNPGYTLFLDYNVMFDLADGWVLLEPVSCFTPGTLIMTADGEVPVESLRVGTAVQTQLDATAKDIIWIGRRSIDCRRHQRPKQVWPVRIAAHAFAPGLPARDLLLSPDHAVYWNAVLIPVKYLINGSTIEQIKVDTIDYYHLELASHDVLLAEHLPVETYLDNGDRDRFSNGGRTVQFQADFSTRTWEAHGCARLCVSGAEVAAVRHHLNERAAACGDTSAMRPARLNAAWRYRARRTV